MSKAPKNIEKILLGLAALFAVGLIVFGVMKAGSVEEDFSPSETNNRRNETAVAKAAQVPEAANSLQLDRALESARVVAEKTPTGDRPVNMFIGVPLFVNRDNLTLPFDPITSPDIHSEIPNIWWLINEVSPNFADSPQRDPDGDGFNNLEEFRAGTDPADSASNPVLVAKLKYVRDDSYEWLVEFGGEISGSWTPKVLDGSGKKNRVSFSNALNPGDIFFSDESGDGILAKRFKFLRLEDREEKNERLNIVEKLRYAIYEEQKENKKGRVYEVPNRMPRAERPTWIHYDRKAVLELNALGEAGTEFTIEEMTNFSLPPGGDDKKYLMKEITPEAITVEWTVDDKTRSVKISKGEMPDMSASNN